MLSSPYPQIAIVGVSALFPGSLTSDIFWQNILEGHDLFSEVPPSHWLIEDYYDPDPTTPDKTYAKRGGFLPKSAFSPMEFGVPPNIVPATDTAQLLALGVAKRVLEDAAGGDFSQMDRDKISVVLGVASATELVGHMSGRLQQPVWERALKNIGLNENQVGAFSEEIANSYVPWQESTFPGLLGNVVAGRIANRLDLGGTNCVIDAACASSFAALELGLNELYLGQSDLVITGGVDTLNDILMYMCFSRTTALSPSGDCRPFSDKADGTMLGEGIGMVALKRLEDAERDGDTIYSVIRALGSSSDGRAKSIYAPVSKGQAKALDRAYERAGYSPETVELLEAHGTGTKAGDAAEFGGMRLVFEEANETKKQWCALGSVKSQIGHTKASAGSAGLFKVAMALHHKVLPPTIKIDRPNPLLDISTSPFYLNTQTRPWIRDASHPRRASVSSFGFGGTNFHIALEEYQGKAKAARLRATSHEVFTWSGKSTKELLNALKSVQALTLTDRQAFQWVAFDSQQNFDANHEARVGLVASNIEELHKKLKALVRHITSQPGVDYEAPNGAFFSTQAPNAGDVAFLFPGQGSQYVAMGNQMAIHFDAAREVWDETANLDFGDQKLHNVVFPIPGFTDEDAKAAQSTLTQTEWAQPAIGATSAAALAMFRALGVEPSAVAGHSYGEVTALYAAGALSAEDFMKVSRQRGELMAKAAQSSEGSMTAVVSDIKALKNLLKTWKIKDVVVANHNSPSQVVMSGATDAIEALEAKLGEEGVKFKRLRVATAFHSHIVSSSSDPFYKFLKKCKFKKPSLDVYSNSEAAPYPTTAEAMRKRLSGQIAQPVRFVEQIEAMYDSGVRTFIEVGPESVLTGLVKRILATKSDVHAVSTDRRGKSGLEMFFTALASLSVRGVTLDFSALWTGYATPVDPSTRKKDKFSIELDGANYNKPSPFREPTERSKQVAKELNASPKVIDMPQKPAAAAKKAPQQAPKVARSAAPATPPTRSSAPLNQTTQAKPMTKKTETVLYTAPGQAQPRALGTNTSVALLEAFERMQRETARAQTEYQRLMAESHTAFLQMAQNSFQQIANVLTGGQTQTTALPQISAPAALPVTSQPLFSAPSLAQAPTPSYSNGATYSNGTNGQHAPAFAAPVATPTAPKRTAPAAPKVQAKAPTVAAPVAAPAPVAKPAAPSVDLNQIMLEVVADKTGYPTEMLELSMELEADLGIDSIKRVEILSAMQERVPTLPEVETSKMAALRTLAEVANALGADATSAPATTTVTTPSAPAPTQAATGDADLVNIMLEVVSDKTGYPTEMLELSMELEADLGIDSIKRVEILSAMQERVPNLPEVETSKMAALRTLQEIVTELGGSTTSSAPATTDAAPASTDTGVDLVAIMLEVVSDKTGYPTEMLELSMELEADLGIDSIKRVEILSAMQERVPTLPEVETSKMAALRTLQEIVDELGGATAGKLDARSSSVAGASAPVASRASDKVERVARYSVRLQESQAKGLTSPNLLAVEEVTLVSTKEDKLAIKLGTLFEAAGKKVHVVTQASDIPETSNMLVFLAQLRGQPTKEAARQDAQEAFESVAAVAERFCATEGHVLVTVQNTGGDFGRSGAGVASWGGGLSGLTKTARQEGVSTVKAIDVHVGARESVAKLAERLFNEIWSGGSEVEVALGPKGTRSTPVSHAYQVETLNKDRVNKDSVIVVSGGARGVTAACVIELAKQTGASFVLLGRTKLMAEEPAHFAGLESDADMKRAALMEAKESGQKVSPKELGWRVSAIRSNREIRSTLAQIESVGARAKYVAVDVRDRQALSEAFATVRKEYGPITGLVHGAGVLADALLSKKSVDQFAKVYDTKVDGLDAMLSTLDNDPLNVICLFSSVAARTGNAGQSDYAMANDVLNRVAWAQAAKRPDCVVKSLGWGPWDGGMVTPVLRELFKRRGVSLIGLQAGAQAFVREVLDADLRDVEAVLGGGVLSGSFESQIPDEGSFVQSVQVSPETMPYLNDHKVQGRVVFPIVMSAELFSRAAQSAQPGTDAMTLDDLRVLKGVVFEEFETTSENTLHVGIESGTSTQDVKAKLFDASKTPRASAQVELGALGEPLSFVSLKDKLEGNPWKSTAKLYAKDTLFHGKKFQVIQSLDGLGQDGAIATLVGVKEKKWPGQWHLDAALLDGCLQVALLWGLKVCGSQTLPLRIQKTVAYSEPQQGELRCELVSRSFSSQKTVSDIRVTQNDRVIMDLRGVEMYAVPSGTN